MINQLKPCPACGGEAEQRGMFASCVDPSCALAGPNGDPSGVRWNAMPRKGDPVETRGMLQDVFARLAALTMTDGELLARTQIACSSDESTPTQMWNLEEIRADGGQAMHHWFHRNALEIKSELDRRAAARKEVAK